MVSNQSWLEGSSRSRKGPGHPGRRGAPSLAAALCAVALGLAACAGGSTAHGPAASGKPRQGGTASYAMPVGNDFSWILPLENQANFEPWDEAVENEMWRPLYYPGQPGRTGIDYGISLAYPPSYSNHDSTVTIRMRKNFKWSDGSPVTNADVRFFFELEAAGARSGRYAPYVAGDMPDDIKSVTYSGKYEITMHLKHSYNPIWFTGNQLSWLYALPAQAWDKTCSTCKVGDAAATPAGAKRVYSFLYGQSEKLSTYASNPLWKVVDGPWLLSGFNPTTYETVLSANKSYTGPGRPHLSKLKIISFSSDTAEVDALRSGAVTFGFLPFSDAPSLKSYERLGYSFKPWYAFYNQSVEFNYTSPTWGPLVRQLYLRQALQHLVNEPLYIKRVYYGYGQPDYGVAPAVNSSYVAPALRKDPYPYSLRAAKELLRAHGWAKGSSGIDVCRRSGSAANECGTGIKQGEALSIRLMYTTESPSLLAQVEAFAGAAKAAGIEITLDGQTANTMYSIAGVCPPGPCNYGMAAYSGFFWDYGQNALVPTGGQEFGHGNYWGGGYNSARADALIARARTASSGLQALYKDETYLTDQVAALWFPLPAQELLLVKNNLGGWQALNPYNFPMASRWYYVK